MAGCVAACSRSNESVGRFEARSSYWTRRYPIFPSFETNAGPTTGVGRSGHLGHVRDLAGLEVRFGLGDGGLVGRVGDRALAHLERDVGGVAGLRREPLLEELARLLGLRTRDLEHVDRRAAGGLGCHDEHNGDQQPDADRDPLVPGGAPAEPVEETCHVLPPATCPLAPAGRPSDDATRVPASSHAYFGTARTNVEQFPTAPSGREGRRQHGRAGRLRGDGGFADRRRKAGACDGDKE